MLRLLRDGTSEESHVLAVLAIMAATSTACTGDEWKGDAAAPTPRVTSAAIVVTTCDLVLDNDLSAANTRMRSGTCNFAGAP
jgi:type IV pilus biogenesis protein CpaD/CtpE